MSPAAPALPDLASIRDVLIGQARGNPSELAAYVADGNGHPLDTLGWAIRRPAQGRWDIIVRGFGVRHTYRRRSAVRLLGKLATIAERIDRAGLRTYIPGRSDRMAQARGWVR